MNNKNIIVKIIFIVIFLLLLLLVLVLIFVYLYIYIFFRCKDNSVFLYSHGNSSDIGNCCFSLIEIAVLYKVLIFNNYFFFYNY